MVRSVALLLFIGTIACGSDAPPPDTPGPSTFELTLGSAVDAMRGTGGFRSVDNDVDLPLRPGAQGGLHVYINLMLPAGAIDRVSDQPAIYREARRIRDGVLVSRLEHKTQLVASSTSSFETERSISVFLCPAPIGVDVADEPLELTVDVMPDYGEDPVARGTLRFVPVCPDEDEELCLRLCLG